MTIGVGDQIPEATLYRMTGEGVRPVPTRELCAGKRVLLFAVPGAFTPACSDEHLPGYQTRSTDLLEAGVDAIACVAVNDAFVMGAWGRDRGVGDDIQLLADGSGELTAAMGLDLDLRAVGLGVRSQRYAVLVDDGVVSMLEVEPGKGVTVSSAEAMLAKLRETA